MPTGVYARAPIAERFWPKVDRRGDAECWPWLGAFGGGGYGQIRVHGKPVGAHRVSYELNCSEIAVGQVIDHLCRNPACVNPKHLEPVSVGENSARGFAYHVISFGRRAATHCKRGHEFTPDNTRIDAHGDRSCVACQRMKANEWRARNRARVNDMQRARRAAQ